MENRYQRRRRVHRQYQTFAAFNCIRTNGHRTMSIRRFSSSFRITHRISSSNGTSYYRTSSWPVSEQRDDVPRSGSVLPCSDRPTRHVLIVCHPYAGEKRGRHTYNTKVRPLLEQALYKTTYLGTWHRNLLDCSMHRRILSQKSMLNAMPNKSCMISKRISTRCMGMTTSFRLLELTVR